MIPAIFAQAQDVNVNINFMPLLKKAMNCDVVADALSRGWEWARNRELIIDDVELLRVYPRSSHHLVLKYNVYLYGKHGDEEQILHGELVHSDVHNNHTETIRSLYRHHLGKLEKRRPADEVDVLQELGMVVRLLGWAGG